MPSSAWAALCSRTRNRAEAGIRGRDMALLRVGSTMSGPQAYGLFNPLEVSRKARVAWSGRTANARFGKRTKKAARSDQVGQDADRKAQQRQRERQRHGGMEEVAEIFVIVENVHLDFSLG